jgi:ADP-heptose:LPS heptosyltransferase
VILIHPFAQMLRNNQVNPKNYPWWPELLERLDGPIVQIGVEQEWRLAADIRLGLPLKEIRALLAECEFWISVDSFLPHLAHYLPKPGVVLWSKSDPDIFGYPENLNLLKDRRYLRAKQFRIWEEESYDPEAFLLVDAVVDAIGKWRASVAPERREMVAA